MCYVHSHAANELKRASANMVAGHGNYTPKKVNWRTQSVKKRGWEEKKKKNRLKTKTWVDHSWKIHM